MSARSVPVADGQRQRGTLAAIAQERFAMPGRQHRPWAGALAQIIWSNDDGLVMCACTQNKAHASSNVRFVKVLQGTRSGHLMRR